MIIIAFSTKTSRLIPQIICREYKHCAPIIINPDNMTMTMYQFVRRNHIVQIPLKQRDIKLLGANGWRFIYIPRDITSQFDARAAKTCVDLSKRAIGMHAPMIQTPGALYRRLSNTMK